MIKAIITDIEGTTTSISFVSDVLFPYAQKRMRDFIVSQYQQPEVAAEIDAVKRELGIQDAGFGAQVLEQVTKTLLQWIDEDKKVTALKTLQGFIWQQGYQDGSLKGHLYPEVKAVLEAWYQQGIILGIYSSGSIAAQKLLFGHSEHGDLTPLFTHYFDTHIGGKKTVDSYHQITNQLPVASSEILFLSDVVAELDAAAQAGLLTLALDRQCICEGFGEHPFVHNFEQIDLEAISR
ncbi:MAG: acireductone synthase [Pseudomonadales bacterium]|nr:acireductone synthase [Pseudomonadales bacterium]